MKVVRTASALVLLVLVFLIFAPSVHAQTDQYGGYTSLPVLGGATGYFRVAKLGNRWVFVTPAGNALWMAGVYALDGSESIPDQGISYDQAVAAKYPDKPTWANQMLKRVDSWGFNAVAEYASVYAYPFGRAPGAKLLPMAGTMRVSWYGLTNSSKYAPGPFKALENCVDSTVYTGWVADGPPDVYDPNFEAYVVGAVKATAADPFWSQLLTSPWMIGMAMDDTDDLQGFGPGLQTPGADGVVSVHIGYLALAVSPTKVSSSRYGVTYADPTVYTKKALRDFLATKYGSIGALNAAWGSSYTTFDSAGGWGTETGLMDENGRHTAWLGATDGTLRGATAGVIADLDAFLLQYASKYFEITAGHLRQYAPNLLVFGPATLNGHGGVTRPQVLQAAAQWVDVIQAGIANQQQLDLTVQAIGDKPIVTWEGTPANPDSSLWRYLNPGFGVATQADRASFYAGKINTLLTTKTTAGGVYPIAGFKWWAWADSWGEKTNWGLVSFRDNAYDGKEAVVAAGTDTWGYTTGGEEWDYGDFISTVSQTNSSIASFLEGASSSPDTAPPVVGITQPASGAVTRKSSVTIAADATDNVGVVKVEFYVNGSLQCVDLVAPYQCAWRVPNGPGKSYTLQAKAYDAAGNTGSSNKVIVVAH